MTIWFTADTHFGHRKIPYYAKRRFCLSGEELDLLDSNTHDWNPSWFSVKKMDDVLIENINNHVKEDDVLWHLGDYCCSKNKNPLMQAEKYRKRILCRNVCLVWGNHDNHRIAKFFKSCHERQEINVRGKHIVLSHYAQAVWNKSHNGSWMLYGHSHGSAEKWLDGHMPDRLSLDVGVDNVFNILGEYRPISFEEIYNIFKNRKGISIDKNKT